MGKGRSGAGASGGGRNVQYFSTAGLPSLQGTPNQVKWATDIRDAVFKNLDSAMKTGSATYDAPFINAVPQMQNDMWRYVFGRVGKDGTQKIGSEGLQLWNNYRAAFSSELSNDPSSRGWKSFVSVLAAPLREKLTNITSASLWINLRNVLPSKRN